MSTDWAAVAQGDDELDDQCDMVDVIISRPDPATVERGHYGTLRMTVTSADEKERLVIGVLNGDVAVMRQVLEHAESMEWAVDDWQVVAAFRVMPVEEIFARL